MPDTKTTEVFFLKKLGNVFILGDSYSTFEGHIPEGYEPYYFNAGRGETDVTRVEETWWYQLLAETDSNLARNSSYSGTPVCNSGYNGSDDKETSFNARFDKLAADGFFGENRIDTVLLFGGTNDNGANSPLGELKYADWTLADLYEALPAYCYLLHRMKEVLPEAKIYSIINTHLKPELVENYLAASKVYGVPTIQLENIDKTWGHPTILGMKQIKEQVLRALGE